MPVVISDFEVTPAPAPAAPPTPPAQDNTPPPSHVSLEQRLRAQADRLERVRAH